jgi:hypothetical protein
LAQADAIEAALAAVQQQRVDRLLQVYLARALRGELVSQDPGDEPASVLLALAPIRPAGVCLFLNFALDWVYFLVRRQWRPGAGDKGSG